MPSMLECPAIASPPHNQLLNRLVKSWPPSMERCSVLESLLRKWFRYFHLCSSLKALDSLAQLLSQLRQFRRPYRAGLDQHTPEFQGLLQKCGIWNCSQFMAYRRRAQLCLPLQQPLAIPSRKGHWLLYAADFALRRLKVCIAGCELDMHLKPTQWRSGVPIEGSWVEKFRFEVSHVLGRSKRAIAEEQDRINIAMLTRRKRH